MARGSTALSTEIVDSHGAARVLGSNDAPAWQPVLWRSAQKPIMGFDKDGPMGEARRRRQNAAQSAAGAADDEPLPSDQASLLHGLSAWNDAHPWEPPPAEPLRVPASEVMVYLVDTSNLWNVVGGVSEEGMNRLIAHAESAPSSLYQRAPGLAGMALLKAAATGARLADTSCQDALTLAGFYLACTETRTEALSRTGSLSGYWLVLLYHLQDGSSQLRPVFAAAAHACKLDAQTFVAAVLDVVMKDLHGSTQVSKRIQGAGGLRLAEPLRARIARQAR